MSGDTGNTVSGLISDISSCPDKKPTSTTPQDRNNLSDFPVVSVQSMGVAISTRKEGKWVKSTNKPLVHSISFPDKTLDKVERGNSEVGHRTVAGRGILSPPVL
jgi:hypothetical protein